MSDEHIQVAVRVRPQMSHECLSSEILQINENTIQLQDATYTH